MVVVVVVAPCLSYRLADENRPVLIDDVDLYDRFCGPEKFQRVMAWTPGCTVTPKYSLRKKYAHILVTGKHTQSFIPAELGPCVDTPVLLASLKSSMDHCPEETTEFFMGRVQVQITRACVGQADKTCKGEKYHRVEVGDKSSRMEAFFYGTDGVKMARTLAKGTYWEFSRFFVRKAPYNLFQLNTNMYNQSEFKKLPRAPPTCSTVAPSPPDETKRHIIGHVMGVDQVYLNKTCSECKKEVRAKVCGNKDCRYHDSHPARIDKMKSYRATCTITIAKGPDAKLVIAEDGARNIAVMGKPWLMTQHLTRIFDPDLVQQLLSSTGKEKDDEDIRELLAEMWQVWADCVRQSNEKYEIAFSNKKYGLTGEAGGGSRYLTSMSINYDNVQTAGTSYDVTLESLKDFLDEASE